MQLALPAHVEVELAPQLGFDLLDAVSSADRIVLVDAMHTGRAPGACVVLDGQAVERHRAGAPASHTIGIAELVELAHRLAPERPRATLHVVGVEGADFSDFGIALSPPVEAAIPEAVQAVLRLIEADEALLTAAAARCHKP